jgi:nucleoside-diphosphate-sugar epimerase
VTAPVADALRGRRCVVTGAEGFVGARMVKRLESVGARVRAWSRRTSDPKRRVDLEDRASLSRAVLDEPPEVVFHLAAVGVAHEQAHDASVIGRNVAMASNLIAALSDRGHHPVLVVAGSMAEYGAPEGPCREDARCTPQTAYGIAKLAASLFALSYGPRRGLPTRVGRLFGLYGPGEAPSRLLPSLVAHLSRDAAVELSDGRQRRDFVHVDDACDALARLASASTAAEPSALLVNVGTGVALSVAEVASWVADALGRPRSLLRFGARVRSPGDADLLVAATQEMDEILRWRPPQRLRPEMDVDVLFAE